MGPVSRYLGPWVPEPQLWQDPVPEVDHPLVDAQDVEALKRRILDTDLSVPQLVLTAWAAAASFRGTDKRGGANGGRIRLAPQKDWEVNNPPQLARALEVLDGVRQEFDASRADGKRVSLADLIVLGGCAAIERAASDGGHDVRVPFRPGRTDASQEQTDAESFAVLEPTFDGFRNYLKPGEPLSPETLLVERANLLTLTAPEMTVLVGGMRALGANYKGSSHGVFTDRPGALTNDFFVNLLDMSTEWQAGSPSSNGSGSHVYEGRDRASGDLRWTATAVDLVFGSNSQLRAIAEVYACDDGGERFVRDFVAAWDKVMNLDRFELA
jgi:catalase-peroxidase